ncbi:MAG: EAL domain-containing protein [Phycisphaerales bacterium]|nr:MAG: EAL domain-containing protein [Phycisphaerales bacterium]
MAYQPIVNPVRQEIVAYEALVRTREPSLPHPGAMFSVAERLGRVHEVGRAIRTSVAGLLSERRPEHDIFLNLHPLDLLDERLFAADAPITAFSQQVVLEVTERATLDRVHDVAGRIRTLRGLGYRVAVDDLGAGYAGLNYFATLSPDVVKIDMALVRNLHLDAVRRRIVGSLCTLCKGLGMLVVAEGVELAEEAAVATELGCDLLQGFLFARPDVAFPRVTWAPGLRDSVSVPALGRWGSGGGDASGLG